MDSLQEHITYAATALHYGINESAVRYIKKNEAGISSCITMFISTLYSIGV